MDMKKKIVKLGFIALSSVMLLGGIPNLLSATQDTKFELTEAPKDMTWVNIVVPFSDTTLEDLASTYYGDVKEASLIYNANKKIIPRSKKLFKGMKLKLPVTEKFRDQPEHLGWN